MNLRSGNTTVIAVLLIVILGVAGFYWYQAGKIAPSNSNSNSGVNTNTLTNTQTNTDISDVPDAPEIASDRDLITAETMLEAIDVNTNSSDSTELDGYLGEF